MSKASPILHTSASVLSAKTLKTSDWFTFVSHDSSGISNAAQLPMPEYSSFTEPSVKIITDSPHCASVKPSTRSLPSTFSSHERFLTPPKSAAIGTNRTETSSQITASVVLAYLSFPFCQVICESPEQHMTLVWICFELMQWITVVYESLSVYPWAFRPLVT